MMGNIVIVIIGIIMKEGHAAFCVIKFVDKQIVNISIISTLYSVSSYTLKILKLKIVIWNSQKCFTQKQYK